MLYLHQTFKTLKPDETIGNLLLDDFVQNLIKLNCTQYNFNCKQASQPLLLFSVSDMLAPNLF